jgi:hypothetical protein
MSTVAPPPAEKAAAGLILSRPRIIITQVRPTIAPGGIPHRRTGGPAEGTTCLDPTSEDVCRAPVGAGKQGSPLRMVYCFARRVWHCLLVGSVAARLTSKPCHTGSPVLVHSLRAA